MHIHKHIQPHTSGTLRPRLLPTGYAGVVVFVTVEASWGDATVMTWGNGAVVEWSNT